MDEKPGGPHATGLDRIRKVYAALDAELYPPPGRLYEAAEHFLTACFFHSDEWPPELRLRSTKIVAKLLLNGNARQSIEQLDNEGVENLLVELRQFCDAAIQLML